MCGIAGFYLKDPSFKFDKDALLTTLLDEIDHRGGHATGFVALGDDGVLDWQKASCDADDFNKHRRRVPAGTRTLLAHTRWATQGLPAFIENNHPIRRGSFYVIHNGHVFNDNLMFGMAKRNPFGDVDSEAIAAYLSSMDDLSALGQVVEAIDGDAAVAAVDERDSARIALARGAGSPLYVYEGRKIVLFASTHTAVKRAHKQHIGKVPDKKIVYQQEGTLLEWKGKTRTNGTFYVPPKRAISWKPSGTTSYSTSVLGNGTGPKSRKLDEEMWNCDNCGTVVFDSDVETRFFPNESLTFMLCDQCAEWFDWDELGHGKEILRVLDPTTVIEADYTDDEEDGVRVTRYERRGDEFVEANEHILKNFTDR